jgi:hypothetical protein
MSPPRVLLAGFAPTYLDRLLPELDGLASVTVASSRGEVLEAVEAHDLEVLCLGPGFSGPAARELLEASRAPERVRRAAHGRRDVVLAAGSDPEALEGLAGENLFYLSSRPPAAEDVVGLLCAALEYPSRSGRAAAAARPAREICELARSLAYETDHRRLSLGVARTSRELTGADRARCVLHDPVGGSLSAWAPRSPDPWAGSAALGIAGWVARTGRAVGSDRAGDDPRFQPAVDDPAGGGDERLLAVPVKLPLLADGSASGGGGETAAVYAVLVVTRSGAGAPFTRLEQRRLELLADRLAPAFERLTNPLAGSSATGGDGPTGPFTVEALRHHGRDGDDLGQPVEVAPRWTRWAFPLLVLALVAGAAYASSYSIGEYAEGVAVVQRDGAAASVVAAFPGRFRPRLEPGMPVHLQIDGLDPGTGRLTIASVGEIVAASEARRLLGVTDGEQGRGSPLPGPAVLVRCPLPEDRSANGEDGFERYVGLAGTAEVRVGSDRLVFSLVPGLRSFLERGRG